MSTANFLVAGGVGAPVCLFAWLLAASSPAAPDFGSESTQAALAGSAGPANGLEWVWMINGPVSADGGGDIVVDADGNVFLAGFHGGLDTDRDNVVDIKSGATAFVGARNPLFVKLSRDAPDKPMTPRWIQSPSTPADRSQTSIAVDQRGGVYVSGSFMESVSFEGGPTLQGAGNNDAFVARYDGDGSVLWARAFGGPGSGDAIYGLASDRAGNAYLVVTGRGTFPLDEGGAVFKAPERRAAALVSYAPDGSVRWVRVFGTGIPLAYGLMVAPSGQIYVTGEIEGEADFDGDGMADLPAPKDRDGYVARFDSEGTLLGAWSLPTPGTVRPSPDGDVYVTGMLGAQMDRRYGPADFDRDGRRDIELRGSGDGGAWIARYSPDGRRRWVRSYALERPADLEVDGDLLVLSGSYRGVRDLDEDGEAEPRKDVVDSSRETDLALLFLSANDGRPQRVLTAPGPGNDMATGIAFLPDRRSLLVTGSLQLTADFTGDGEFGEGWIVCENLGDLFVASYRLPEPTPEPVVERPREPTRREIALELSLTEREGRLRASLSWSGASGEQVEVYRNGVRIATVANDGTHTDEIPREGVTRPFLYRLCEVGSTTCSSTKEARR